MTISATNQGLRPGVCLSTNRPAAPFDGMVIYETDTNTLAVYDGSAWVSLNPISTDRNMVVNGGFDVWQRGTTFNSIGNTNYSSDRWWVVSDGVGAVNVSRQAIASQGLGFTYCLRAERSSGTNRWVIGTNLESIYVDRMKGKTVVLSFYARKGSALSSNVSVAIATKSTEAKFGSNVDSTSLTVSNASMNTSTFTRFSKTLDVPVGTSAVGFSVEFTADQAGATNAFFEIAGVQLEVGAVATPFEFEDYGTTLTKCERYFETSFRLSQTPGHNSGNFRPIPSTSFGCGGNSYFTLPMRVRKRTASPTLRIFDSSSSRTFSENWWRYIVSCNSGVAVGPNVGIALSNTDELFISGYLQGSTGAGVLFDWTVEAEL